MESEQIYIAGDFVKSDQFGMVSGYLVRFGDPTQTDLTGDFFTKSTDFGFPTSQSNPINLYYQHGMDKAIKTKPIGSGVVTADEIGLWIQAQIDISDDYGKAIAKLASDRRLGFSSGAAGHLVSRKKSGEAWEITQWAIAEASLTPNPAEPRNMTKSLDDYMSEMSMDDEMPVLSDSMSPEQFASDSFSESGSDITEDALECLFECLSSGIKGAIQTKGENAYEYVSALIDEFANRSKLFVQSITANPDLVKCYIESENPSVRKVERRLRDAVGLSRDTAKLFASLIKTHQTVGDDQVDQTVRTQDGDPSTDQERADIIERLNLLEML